LQVHQAIARNAEFSIIRTMPVIVAHGLLRIRIQLSFWFAFYTPILWSRPALSTAAHDDSVQIISKLPFLIKYLIFVSKLLIMPDYHFLLGATSKLAKPPSWLWPH